MAKLVSFVFVFLLVTAHPLAVQAYLYELAGAVAGVAGGVAVVTVAAPVVLGAVCFGAAGITAGSIAAKTMSIAYSSGVGLSTVAALQSAGAAGVGTVTALVGGLLGGGAGYFAGSQLDSNDNSNDKRDNN